MVGGMKSVPIPQGAERPPWRDVLAELGTRGCGAGAQQSPRRLFPLVVPKSFLGPRASSLHMSLDHNCP